MKLEASFDTVQNDGLGPGLFLGSHLKKKKKQISQKFKWVAPLGLHIFHHVQSGESMFPDIIPACIPAGKHTS